MKRYDGSVVFVQGVHYAVDEDGHADLTRPLRWEDDGYRDAKDGDPLHNDVHHVRHAAVEPDTLLVHDPGRLVYPAGAHVVTADGQTYFLADETGAPLHEEPLRWDSATQTFRGEGAD